MDRDIVHPEIDAYLTDLAGSSPPVALEMERLAAERGFPIVGPLVGRLLLLLAQSIGARRVFELGSGFGYSAFWFATAVGPEGHVIHTDGSAERSAEAGDLLSKAGLGDRLEYRVGEATALLEPESGPFDIIFCDIDKEAYPRVPALALPRLRPGGLLIFDNTLWHGRVPDADGADEATAAVQGLNRGLAESADFDTVIVPLRDGVTVARKR